jgi:Tol biopolymer transport system component
VLGVQCQRVHFAAGQGLCLRDDPLRGGAFLLDADLNVRHRLPSNGITSRARVSPDGKLASMTVFVKGHSYNDGNFSTETTLIDTVSGTSIGNLESFTVLRDGAPIKREDFNFWGVTFARDGNRFYATLGTGGQTFLVEGDLASRQMRTLRENVECPSLSPDNSRLVFKKRVDGGRGPGAVWQLHVLDLTTMTERPIGETRNIDDQVEWLDDNQILYSLRDEGPPATIRPDIWSVSVDGGAPSRLVTGGLSPAVVR